MSKIRILIWDDDENQANKIRSCVENSKERHGWDIEVQSMYGKYQEFEKYLRANYKDFNLLIVDCLEGRSNKVIKRLLEMLASKDADIRVIAVTIDSLVMGEEFINLGHTFDFCRPVFKSHFYNKLSIESCEILLSEELNLTKSKRGLTHDIKLNIEPDIYLHHLLNILGGEDNLKMMIHHGKKVGDIETSNDTFIIKPLSQGLSGAIVLKLQYYDKHRTETRRFVKISSDGNKLMSELHKVNNEYEHFPSEYRLSYKNDKTRKYNTNYYIMAELIGESISLRNYLQKDNTANRLLPIIRELMLDCFKSLYAKACDAATKKTRTERILEIFLGARLSYLRKSIKELEIITGIDIEIINTIHNILKNYTMDSNFYTNDCSNDVWVHGDLHCNNILINQIDAKKNKIIIIDPANMHVSHWSRDICMLIVDIFTYGIDAGQREFYGISNIEKWKNLGIDMLKNISINNDEKNQGVIDSLNWLINTDNLKDIFPPGVFNLWEFQLSLCVEFLRISYKQDQLPPGKRAACLMIGVEAFDIALKTFNSTKPT